ncbi:MAG TPA: polyamine aminopropyltransferase [Anaerolineae bacterium]|nr:polyamine aminopropyltransferase [Anaerolineae bacterium]HID84709.1 polyamine aminopropyltransferase [Anaerolineales bacterium]HIQ09430.1 polyamine aminopropyltransferase [Anaerolineaceae bacterium]
MITLPKYVSLTSGHAEGVDGLTAFDNALMDAGIHDLNLIKVSSIVPQGSRLVPLREFPVGSLVPTVYVKSCSDVPGTTVAAAVGLGLSPNGRGMIMEGHLIGTRAEVEALVRRRVEEAFAVRGLELHEYHVASAEHTVVKNGCAIAAAVLWGDELEEQPEDWITEAWTPDTRFSVRVRGPVFSLRSPYQHIDIVDTFQFGRMLWLDETVQTSEADEWAYHEMLVHVPLFTHPHPGRVLLIGGGDGGALRTILQHPVEQVVMVELDREVVRAAREYLTTIHRGAFDDPRARLVYEDAYTYLERSAEPFDVVILDIPDPIGPAMRLFTAEFYGLVQRNLAPEAVIAAQSGSPWLQPEVLTRTQQAMRAHFPQVHAYLGHVPTYPAGLWSFSLATQGLDPMTLDWPQVESRFAALDLSTHYYIPAVHRAAFTLPPFVQRLLEA